MRCARQPVVFIPLIQERDVKSESHCNVPEISSAVLPVQGEVREEFSPLLYHLFANYVASYVAARLGRSLFHSDRPALLQSVDEYYASLQHDAAH